MNRFDNIQVARATLAHYRAKPRKLETLKIGQRGTVIDQQPDGALVIQFEDYPALLVVSPKALERLHPQPAPHNHE